jgi:hypothetical protein
MLPASNAGPYGNFEVATSPAMKCKPKRICRILSSCALLAGKVDDVPCSAHEK